MNGIENDQCNYCIHKIECEENIFNPNVDIADDGETPVCNDYKTRSNKLIVVAEITEGFDGQVIKDKICASDDDAGKFIRDESTNFIKPKYRNISNWWYVKNKNGDIIVDFGSHIYFGRIKKEVTE